MRSARQKVRCGLCARRTPEEMLDAGADLGVVHRRCFIEWDHRQEAVEQMLARSFSIPLEGEDSAEPGLRPGDCDLPDPQFGGRSGRSCGSAETTSSRTAA